MEVVVLKVVNVLIYSLDQATFAKTLRLVNLLEKFGHLLGMPHSRKISSKLFELRIRGAKEVRIFYTLKTDKIYLLHGFIKKTQKTPRQEIEKAVNRMKTLDI